MPLPKAVCSGRAYAGSGETAVASPRFVTASFFGLSRLFPFSRLFLIVAFAASPAAAVDFPRPTPYSGAADKLHNISAYAARAVAAGVPAYWDGEKLRGEDDTTHAPPPWFTNGFPAQPLAGLLLAARADLDAVTRIAKQEEADAGWRKLRFVVFDLPEADGDFATRQQQLRRLVDAANLPQLRAAKWRTFPDAAALKKALAEMYKSGDGGLVLRRTAADYAAEGEGDLLLLLPYALGEAVVLAHRPGKGELSGMMGSMEVSAAISGKFLIGSGFNRAERRNPPPPGANIEYKYKGLTETGKPKNPVFLRPLAATEKKIGGWLTTQHLIWFFILLMLTLATLDATTHRRGGRQWNFKSAIVSTGLLGTFIGIWWGLYNFDTADIAAGVPALLDGLKLSFVTSIVGITLSTLLSVAQTIAGGDSD